MSTVQRFHCNCLHYGIFFSYSSASSSAAIVYIVVSLGVGMLVMMSLLLMFMALALLHHRLPGWKDRYVSRLLGW